MSSHVVCRIIAEILITIRRKSARLAVVYVLK